MVSLNLKLLPDSENPVVAGSNEVSEKSFQHLTSILGWQKCKKHPSFKNVINVVAVEGKIGRAHV